MKIIYSKKNCLIKLFTIDFQSKDLFGLKKISKKKKKNIVRSRKLINYLLVINSKNKNKK